uniref:Uncharacterized protein n=1 Tax=Eubacterium cellulosolvens (strain ATCC 43171 / JCM 9499 / 6) TaxID=633697 RepID=I5ART8_EUBC6
MNRNIYEGRFLVSVIGGIIRQDETFPMYNKRLSWERLYRLADYHSTANIVYLGILGSSTKMDEAWKERFYRRYQQALRYNDIYASEEATILGMLDANDVQCVILESTSIREFYEIPETASNSSLRLLFSEEDYDRAKGYLIDNGYETDAFYSGFGEHMVKSSGFTIQLYYNIPVETEFLQQSMRRLIAGAYLDPQFKGISALSMEYNYVFKMTETIYLYCCDLVTIRHLLDTYLMYRGYREDMDMGIVTEKFKKMKIDQLAEGLLQIAAMWFGKRDDDFLQVPKDSLRVYDEIESRILSNGLSGVDSEMEQALELRQAIAKAREKEAKEAEKQRKREAKRAEKARTGGFLGKVFGVKKNGEDDRSDAGIRIEGNVTCESRVYGIVVSTPYYTFTLPDAWRYHGKIVCSKMKEDYSRSQLHSYEKNPDEYKISIMMQPKGRGAEPLPIMDILLFSDDTNAAIEARKDNGYYLGMLTHMDEKNEYDQHVVAVYHSAIPENEDLQTYELLQEKRDAIASSIIPVNDPTRQNVNMMERFDLWKTEEMPDEYRRKEE